MMLITLMPALLKIKRVWGNEIAELLTYIGVSLCRPNVALTLPYIRVRTVSERDCSHAHYSPERIIRISMTLPPICCNALLKFYDAFMQNVSYISANAFIHWIASKTDQKQKLLSRFVTISSLLYENFIDNNRQKPIKANVACFPLHRIHRSCICQHLKLKDTIAN